jgi:hypothetical protein
MGRQRKNGKRTASGQLSRSAEARAEARQAAERVSFEQGPMQTVLQARRRHRRAITVAIESNPQPWRKADATPVSKEQMVRQKLRERGSIIGVMWAEGKLTAQELAAGNDYCQRYLSYASLNGLPRPTPQAPSYGEVRGGSRPERIRAAIAAKAAHVEDQRILRHCSAGVVPAIMRACVRDEAAPTHQVKEGLAALVKAGR